MTDKEFTYRIVREWNIQWAHWGYVVLETSTYTLDGKQEVRRYDSVPGPGTGTSHEEIEAAHRAWAERNAEYLGVEIEE